MGLFEVMALTAVAVAGVTILLMVLAAIGRKSLRDTATKWMNENGFSDYRVAFTPGDAIAIDYENKRVAFQASGKQKILNFDQIVSVEICEDGATISKTNRSGQVAGATIGAIALGPVGAVIGGLSGSTTSKQKVSKVSINVITKDIDMPFVELKVYHDQPIDKGSLVYGHETKALMEWYARLRVILETA